METQIERIDVVALVDGLAAIEPAAAADRSAVRVVRAPGRVNLIGEHTDYNEGHVLPVAIDRAITIALLSTDDRRVTITLADDGETAGFELDALASRQGHWIDYVAGTAWAMAEAGLPVRGFRGLLASDLPRNVGLSSSAALELASALALSGGQEPGSDRMTLARIAQRGENVYVGVQCGLMDQFASALGSHGVAMLLDCRSLEYRAVPMPRRDVTLVVCDSGSERRLDGSAYNARREQCEEAVRELSRVEPGVRSLRDVTPGMLDAISDALPPVSRLRARHVVEENERVLEAADALEAGDIERAGRLFDASHASLRDLYDVSSPELDALVDIAGSVPGVYGSRLTGAGFGGCTISLVRPDAVEALADAVRDRYPSRTGRVARVFEVEPSAGASVVEIDG